MRATALTVIHKFIRRELFDVSERISRAGPDDTGDVRAALEAVAALLHGHASHEEAMFEPPLRDRDLPCAERLAGDHHRLHEELDAVRAAAQALNPTSDTIAPALLALNRDWNRFVGGYLLHLDDEERAMFASLDDIIPPIEFVAQAAIAQGDAEGRAFLERLWKVLAPSERKTIERAHAAAR